jgi:ribosome-binding protein aMBF1 (putative translation factor)
MDAPPGGPRDSAGLKCAGASGDDRRVRPELATTVSQARRAAGLSQATLARRAGISPSYLSRIEARRGSGAVACRPTVCCGRWPGRSA